MPTIKLVSDFHGQDTIELEPDHATYAVPEFMIGEVAYYDPDLALLKFRASRDPGHSETEMTKLGPKIPVSNRLYREKFLVDLTGILKIVKAEFPGVMLWVAQAVPVPVVTVPVITPPQE